MNNDSLITEVPIIGNNKIMYKNLINTKRKGWVDALRGMAIILVVYGHSAKGFSEYFLFTSPIKMPLFFAISGYVFNLTESYLNFLGEVKRRTSLIEYIFTPPI